MVYVNQSENGRTAKQELLSPENVWQYQQHFETEKGSILNQSQHNNFQVCKNTTTIAKKQKIRSITITFIHILLFQHPCIIEKSNHKWVVDQKRREREVGVISGQSGGYIRP